MSREINGNGLYRLQAHDNVTRPKTVLLTAEKHRSATFRRRPTEYEGIPRPSYQFSNFYPQFESKAARFIERASYEDFAPPHASVDRHDSILSRSRWLQEEKRAARQQMLEDYVREHHGARSLIGLVKGDYQVPVCVTKKDFVVSTKNPRQCDGYYRPSVRQVYERVYYHM